MIKLLLNIIKKKKKEFTDNGILKNLASIDIRFHLLIWIRYYPSFEKRKKEI